jgi:hypothetical protein
MHPRLQVRTSKLFVDSSAACSINKHVDSDNSDNSDACCSISKHADTDNSDNVDSDNSAACSINKHVDVNNFIDIDFFIDNKLADSSNFFKLEHCHKHEQCRIDDAVCHGRHAAIQ